MEFTANGDTITGPVKRSRWGTEFTANNDTIVEPMKCPKCWATEPRIGFVTHLSSADCIDPRFKFEGAHAHWTCSACGNEWAQYASPAIG